jgi:hypothetical protein
MRSNIDSKWRQYRSGPSHSEHDSPIFLSIGREQHRSAAVSVWQTRSHPPRLESADKVPAELCAHGAKRSAGREHCQRKHHDRQTRRESPWPRANRTGPGSEGLQESGRGVRACIEDTEGDLGPCSLRAPGQPPLCTGMRRARIVVAHSEAGPRLGETCRIVAR